MYNHEILKGTSDIVNDKAVVETNNNFILISRLISSIILLTILYLSFDTYINSLIGGYEYGGKNNRPSVLLFIPGMLFISMLGIKSVMGFKIYNTVLIGLFIFYGLLALVSNVILTNILQYSISILSLLLFVYSICNTKLYGLKKSELMILKLK